MTVFFCSSLGLFSVLLGHAEKAEVRKLGTR